MIIRSEIDPELIRGLPAQLIHDALPRRYHAIADERLKKIFKSAIVTAFLGAVKSAHREIRRREDNGDNPK